MKIPDRAYIISGKPASHRLNVGCFDQFTKIFNYLPNVIFYVKDHKRRWVTCNHAALKLLRRDDLSEIIGAREEDFFPEAVAAAIKKDDLRILKSGEVIVDVVELISNEHGELVWVKTTKLPVKNTTGAILGLLGITQLLEVNTELPPRFEKFRAVVKMIDSCLDSLPSVSELAVTANMSESHFRRTFKQCFGIAPQEFMLQQRLRHAAKLLTQTDLSITQVALDSGFGDQSHFSRQFGRFFGQPPRSYRLHWR